MGLFHVISPLYRIWCRGLKCITDFLNQLDSKRIGRCYSGDAMSQRICGRLFILVGSLGACATRSPGLSTPPSTSPTTVRPLDSARTSSVFDGSIYRPGNVRYTVQLKSIVQTAV